MNRSMYDNDITTWSPQGRLHQVEYAMEAVKQGSASVGLKSNTHAIVCAVQRSASELSSTQKKIFDVDDHMGIAIAGLTADARVLCKYMRTECLNHRYVYESALPAQRLVTKIANKAQINTHQYGRRPYGVGLLVAAYDQKGAHLYETCPSGNFFDWKAQSIGARSQSAKTYLERHWKEFADCTKDQLIKHGLAALRETLSTRAEDKEPLQLTPENCAVGIVGVDCKFTILSGDDLQKYITELEGGDDKMAE
eukprot:TRINITY_DN6350_c0_g1_i1.p2 TRINITY_DN6350_c0_g1~~TRINITY_DN6350_c0_g1_i1.p2  ORF type:complete len:252 (+),score=62.60 TRINITY_DN6350_c0_g1_i1:65-820(+)